MGTQSPHQVVLPLRHSLWRRGNARNVSFETIYGGQFTKLMIPNYLVLWMNDSRQEHEDCSGLQRRKTRLLWLMELYCCLLLHRKRYQSKVLVVHSKAARCSFWGPLPCYDRRSPWLARRDGPQHDSSRSDAITICTSFKSYTSLVIFFIIAALHLVAQA